MTRTLTTQTASAWVDRWDAQQQVNLPDREERFTVLIDAVQECAGRPDPLVLDLGCGPGSLAVRLLDRIPAATVVAVDVDQLLLALGRAAWAAPGRPADGAPPWRDALVIYINEVMDLSQPAADLLEVVALVIRGVSDNRDLSLTAVSTLGSLNRYGPQRVTALAGAEGVSQPSMTQLVQRLEQRGLVARRSDPADGRVALVAITGEGREALAARRARSAARIAELLADLPEDDVGALGDALTALLPAIRRRLGIGGGSGAGAGGGSGAGAGITAATAAS